MTQLSILRHPGVLSLLNLAQPLAVLCTSILHFVADEAGPHKIIAEYRDHLAPGSYLAITHGTLEDDPAGEGAAAERVYRQASSQLHLRPLPDVLRLFEGFELIEPGLTWITEWRPEPGTEPTGAAALHARRPRPQALAGEWWWMRPSVAVSGWPVPPQRSRISPAAIETAVSSGVLAPRSSPIGDRVTKPARPSRMSSGSKQSVSTQAICKSRRLAA